MRKRIIITILICGALAAITALVLTMTSRDDASRPAPEATASPPAPSASPDPSLPPAAERVYEENIESLEDANPVVARVPKQTPYWRVELLGSGRRDGKLVLDATVYVKPGGDKQRAIQKQRPFIEGWLKEIGQAPGTYVLDMRTEAPHVY